MQAVAFQEPYRVEVVDKAEPELTAPDDAIVRVDDLHTILDGLGAGDTLELTLVRGVDERTVTVTFDADDS